MPGSFIFKPIEANLLPGSEIKKILSPYCSVIFGDQKFSSKECKNGGKHPIWNDSIKIPIIKDIPEVKLELMDKDPSNKEILGSCSIRLKDIENLKQIRKWYPLYYKNKPAGEILMETDFDEGELSKESKDKFGFKSTEERGREKAGYGYEEKTELDKGLRFKEGLKDKEKIKESQGKDFEKKEQSKEMMGSKPSKFKESADREKEMKEKNLKRSPEREGLKEGQKHLEGKTEKKFMGEERSGGLKESKEGMKMQGDEFEGMYGKEKLTREEMQDRDKKMMEQMKGKENLGYKMGSKDLLGDRPEELAKDKKFKGQKEEMYEKEMRFRDQEKNMGKGSLGLEKGFKEESGMGRRDRPEDMKGLSKEEILRREKKNLEESPEKKKKKSGSQEKRFEGEGEHHHRKEHEGYLEGKSDLKVAGHQLWSKKCFEHDEEGCTEKACLDKKMK